VFIAARLIQCSWRRAQAREETERRLIERNAATTIQSAWRGFVCYTDYIFTIADIITAQRVARKFLARGNYAKMREDHGRNVAAVMIQKNYRGHKGRSSAELYRGIAEHDRQILEFNAATKIQKVARGHITQTAYRGHRFDSMVQVSSFEASREAVCATTIAHWWKRVVVSKALMAWATTIQRHVAASTIQEWWRIILLYKTEKNAAIKIQKVARGHIAHKAYRGQRFDSMVQASALEASRGAVSATAIAHWWKRVMVSKALMAWATTIRRHVAASTIQEWWRIVLFYKAEKEAADRAARIIQRFFLMVKIEVDRAIQAEKERRRKKNEWKKKRTPEAEDALLESIWLNTVESLDDMGTKDRSTTSASGFRQRSASAPRAARLNRSSSKRDGVESNKRHRRAESTGRSRRSSHNSEDDRIEAYARAAARDSSRSKPRLPPRYSGDRSVGSRLPADSVSIATSHDDAASEISGLTALTPRHVSSRLASFTSKDLQDDYSLEEAWIDAEIYRVKEKHRSASRKKSRSGAQH
jgi:hypothetical protein